jgi:polyphosphate kinase
VRFVYDKEMDPGLLEFLIRKLNLTKRDNIIPGGRIHNFREFMDFPRRFLGASAAAKTFSAPGAGRKKSIGCGDAKGPDAAFSLSFLQPGD